MVIRFSCGLTQILNRLPDPVHDKDKQAIPKPIPFSLRLEHLQLRLFATLVLSNAIRCLLILETAKTKCRAKLTRKKFIKYVERSLYWLFPMEKWIIGHH